MGTNRLAKKLESHRSTLSAGSFLARSETKAVVITVAKAALLLLAILLTFEPAFHAQFIWDDDGNVTANPALRNLEGLILIWTDPETMTQYYPLLYTTFWIEHALFGLDPAPFHALNVMLHGVNAILLWRVLLFLEIPGAWFIAALFGLHPVQVETVAWITELKNIQSGFFYLTATLAYLHFDRRRRESGSSPCHSGLYALSLLLFIAATLTKTVTATLPAALLLLAWWKRGTIHRGDVLPLLPMLVVVLPLGVLTAGSESALGVNRGFSWDPTFFERFLNAGRSICFYAWKLIWPREFTFIYSGWKTDSSSFAQYLFPLAALALPGVLWLLRDRLGRGPLVAVLYYGGTLFPALGFLEIYFFRFAPVSDHWQYLACIGLFALLVGSVHRFVELFLITRPVAIAAGVLTLVFLGHSSHQYAYAFHSSEALFRDSLSKNPDSVMTRFNLGTLLQQRNALDEAEMHFEAALAIDSQHVPSIHNLGFLYFQEGNVERGIQQFRQCLELAPFHIRARFNLGIALERQGRIEEAFQEMRRALETNSADAVPWLDPGEYERIYLGHLQFGDLLLKHGRRDEAAVQYRKALTINPDHAPSHIRLGTLLAKNGNPSKAANHFRIALRINPNSQIARRYLDRLQASGSPLQQSPAPTNRSEDISQPQSEQ